MAIAYLQTGFRCPEIFTIAAVAILDVGKEATQRHLDEFYISSAVVVLIGLVAWVVAVTSRTSGEYFAAKDERATSAASDTENQPLLQPSVAGRSKGGMQVLSLNGNHSNENLDFEAGRNLVVNDKGGNNDKTFDSQAPDHYVPVSPNHKPLRDLQGQQSPAPKPGDPRVTAVTGTVTVGTVVQALPLRPDSLWALYAALFITIWCSIFMASFFAYVDSSADREIEQILYFVRLFSDLLGRPLTRLPRPFFLEVRNCVSIPCSV